MKPWLLALILSLGVHGAFLGLPGPQPEPTQSAVNGASAITLRLETSTASKPPDSVEDKKQSAAPAGPLALPDASPKPKSPKSLHETQVQSRAQRPSPKTAVASKTLPSPAGPQAPTGTAVRKEAHNQEKAPPESLPAQGPQGKKNPPGPNGTERALRELKEVYQVMPVYPTAARRERREGEVLLKVEVLENGTVGEIKIARSSRSPDLDAAAITAVRQWRFEPALRNAQPIQQTALLPIRFHLNTD